MEGQDHEWTRPVVDGEVEVNNAPAVNDAGAQIHTEIGRFSKPPLLEDVTVEGPLRLSKERQLLRTIEGREDVEYDFNWYRYSNLSKFFLTAIFVFLAVSLWLTIDQNNGQLGYIFPYIPRVQNYGQMRGGVPRYLEPYYTHDFKPDYEGGLNRAVRTFRIFSFSFGFVSVLLMLGAIFLKPRPGPKLRLIFLVSAIFALGTVICSALAFSYTRGTNARVYEWEEDYRLTFSPRQEISGWVQAATLVDIFVFAVSITVFLMNLVWGMFNRDIGRERTGWREYQRNNDARTGGVTRAAESHDDRFYRYHTKPLVSPAGEKVGERNYVRESRTQLATFVGLAFLLVVAAQLWLTLIVHQHTVPSGRVYNWRGKGNRAFRQDPWDILDSDRLAAGNWLSTSGLQRDYDRSSIHIDDTVYPEVSGWPITNTRLRLFCVLALIVLTFVTLLPFRSRVVAYSLAILWWIVGVAWFSSAIIDLDEVHTTTDLPCPIDIATAVDYRPRALREQFTYGYEGVTYDNGAVQGDPFLASSEQLRARMVWQYKCQHDRYWFTAFVSLFGSLLVFAFVLLEYLSKQFTKCQWCGRGYLFCEKRKHETKECSMRPVECEICHMVMPAQEFVFRHRLTCGKDHVKCRYCGVLVPQGYLAKHEAEMCPEAPVPCSMCGVVLKKKDFTGPDSHVLTCPMMPTTCEFCGADFPRRDIAAHKAACAEKKIECPYCGLSLKKAQWEHHEKFQCKFRFMVCDGCGEEIRALEMESHKKRECPARLVICERCGAAVAASDRQLHASVCPARDQ
jgi:hypothetical protein